MGHDFRPYWCRTDDVHQADGPYLFGAEVDLVEMPVSWILDDFPHFEYLALKDRRSPGLSAASKVEEIWRDEFRYMYRDVPGGVFTLTMHPQVIGRGHRLLMLERLMRTMAELPGVRFRTMADVARDWRAANPLPHAKPRIAAAGE